jgi:aminoglycoside phosphotransferase (APT) family kinase protein
MMQELASPPTTPIADSIDDLTTEWFTSALREGGTIPARGFVTEARSELIGTGQVGSVVRSELAYDAAGPGAPASVVVKLPATDPSRRQTGIVMGLYESEVRFYKEIAPLAAIAVPRLHWADVEPDKGRATLVIDDLTGCTDAGDMITGSTPEQAELAFAELVKLQAPLWNDPGLRELPWLADTSRAQVLFDAVAPAVGPFKEAYGDRLEPEHIALVERLAPKASSWPAKALVDPLVPIHGDFRLDNMMFGTGADMPAITILDWQASRLGPPLLDHTIFLGSCMSIAQRRAHERDLLRGYHEGLLASGVRDFTFDDCLESYRRSSLYPFLLTVSMAMFLGKTDRDREIWTRLLRGAAQIVQDTGAADFLD